jgi:hypothetical protein
MLYFMGSFYPGVGVNKKLEMDGLCLFATRRGDHPTGEAPRMDA